MRAVDYARCLGVTGRQLDYWTRQGFIYDEPPEQVMPGSGNERPDLTRHEALRLRIMAHLVQGGMLPLRARQLAEKISTDGHAFLEPCHWLVITTESVLASVREAS